MLGAVGGAFGDAIAALSDDANGGGWRRRCYCVRTQPVRQGWREGEWRNQDGNGEEGLPEPQLLHCLLRGRKGIDWTMQMALWGAGAARVGDDVRRATFESCVWDSRLSSRGLM